jgi:hypothetical protein
VSSLLDFVRARLDEREAAAKAAGGRTWMWRERGPAGEIIAPLTGTLAIRIDASTDELRHHIALNDPAAVLDDIAAKRRILDACEREAAQRHEHAEGEARAWLMDEVLEALAAPYAGHPGFDPAWARR